MTFYTALFPPKKIKYDVHSPEYVPQKIKTNEFFNESAYTDRFSSFAVR